jgi:hypothetical protein
VRAGLCRRVATDSGAVTVAPGPAGRGLALFADVSDSERRDAVVAMRVLPRRRNEIGEPVEDLKRREFDHAVGPRPRGLPPASRAAPVGGFVPWQHVADATDAATFAADHGEPLQREGQTGAIPQEVFQTLKIARHVAVDERDPDADVHGDPTVFSGEHDRHDVGVSGARNRLEVEQR